MTFAGIFADMVLHKVFSLVGIWLWTLSFTCAQSFTSYFLGDTTDVITATIAGTVLMGGAGENDNAMRWFLERAAGGDVLVLRTSGEDGYNDYFYNDLGIVVNSVETIVCHTAASGSDPYVVQQAEQAEAIWFAGGDQWDYISFWRDTPLETALNSHINEKQAPIGGTSAGCAIQGQAYFSAENGTITSMQALNDPFHNLMTLGNNDFLNNPHTASVITDTHYDNPDRRGRHTVFLARLYADTGMPYYGIGVEEYTAVCIDEHNVAYVFGSYPDYDDFAFFLQPNCVMPNTAETCLDGEKLTWDRNDAAVKVIRVAGTDAGTGFVDMNDWKTTGGADIMWQNWWVEDGMFNATNDASAIDCTVQIGQAGNILPVTLFPNPAGELLTLRLPSDVPQAEVKIFSAQGVALRTLYIHNTTEQFDISALPSGFYAVTVLAGDQMAKVGFVKQ